MTNDIVELEATPEGLATVTLNRPDMHNAFDDETISRLSDVFTDLAAQDGVRAVVLAARGPSFCAGADLNWMRRTADFTADENRADAQALGAMLHRLDTMPMPTIALVQGPAYGGGVGLVAACDIAIAVRGAVFALTEVRLGLIPATISPYVVAAIGARHARRYFLTAERFDADEACRLGLVHEVVDDADALAAARDRYLRALGKGGPGALAAAKELVFAVAGRPIDDHLVADTARRIAERRASEEGREGTAAFLEKRRPGWVR